MEAERVSGRVVLYLTGAPASGKSSTAALLGDIIDARVLSYGALLATSPAIGATHSELRQRSAALVNVDAVRNLDDEMAGLVAGIEGHCVIDSHAVTLERWGFRAVPFGPGGLEGIGVTAIACLYADPVELVARSAQGGAGRPATTPEVMALHQDLQMSLALTYAHTARLPVYFVCSEGPPEDVARRTADALGFGED